jgi:magnesium chelatase family protein
VAIVRARHSAVYPARFMLLAATNPCPCGYAGEHERCSCRETDMTRHRRRLSGPLLDRIDLLVMVGRLSPQQLRAGPSATSEQLRELVLCARERQARRLRGEHVRVNAHMSPGMLRSHADLDAAGELMLTEAHQRGLLSMRGAHRVLRVARTLADLEGSERIRSAHLGQALSLRAETLLRSVRAA